MPPTSQRTPSRIVQSRQNSRVKELRAGFAPGSRSKTGRVGIEGEHLLLEAVRSDLAIACVFVRSGNEAILDRLELPSQIEILELPPEVFASAVTTESPQGIAALVMPALFSLDDLLRGETTLIVIAAGLQDPGNLGTLLRSAEAFGATGALLLPGTVSPWNPKALRASSGSAFRLPILTMGAEESFAALRAAGVRTLAAVPNDGDPAPTTNLTGPLAVLVGNEGSGLPPVMIARSDGRITIPCPGPVESLNAAVAASVLLYECSRQRAAR